MKSDKRILIAFFLNLFFSVVECIGGIFTGSVAILSDAVHDLGDSISIGLSYILEKISRRNPDKTHTYGYFRYSVLGSLITTFILISGSVFVVYNSILRIINPIEINYNGMIFLAVFGVVINFIASYFTSEGHSLNQKSVNLHMLEDMLGWIVVLIGAIIMKFTDISYIDPIMSICLAIFILINAYKNLMRIADVFLEKTPNGISVDELSHQIMDIEGVCGVHHLHIRSIDGFNNIATLHIISDSDPHTIKDLIRKKLYNHNIVHVTIEIETSDENCHEKECDLTQKIHSHNEHHHHHHHH